MLKRASICLCILTSSYILSRMEGRVFNMDQYGLYLMSSNHQGYNCLHRFRMSIYLEMLLPDATRWLMSAGARLQALRTLLRGRQSQETDDQSWPIMVNHGCYLYHFAGRPCLETFQTWMWTHSLTKGLPLVSKLLQCTASPCCGTTGRQIPLPWLILCTLWAACATRDFGKASIRPSLRLLWGQQFQVLHTSGRRSLRESMAAADLG